MSKEARLSPSDTFVHRHVGPSDADVTAMLTALGLRSLDELTAQTIPEGIRMKRPLDLGAPRGEHELLAELHATATKNRVLRSFIGQGYYDTITPPVILRNILENPAFYTQYTPYQAEIAQGRLEALLNFQTMVGDLTGFSLANASLLDEATAAAEAMTMCHRIAKTEAKTFFISDDCHPQTIAVVATRAEPLGIGVEVGPIGSINFASNQGSSTQMASHPKYFGVLASYPTTDGRIVDLRDLVKRAHDAGALVAVATDLLALALVVPPGELGADIAIGSSQRFGVPLGFGGPHAAFLATDEKHSRHIPGRIIGVSKDARGKPAMRLALQTREQHIRRDRATSNICTAQVLLAVIAGMYAVYHGPEGIRRIAERVRGLALAFAEGARKLGFTVEGGALFDTVHVETSEAEGRALLQRAEAAGMLLRSFPGGHLGVSMDETTTIADVERLLEVFAEGRGSAPRIAELSSAAATPLPEHLARKGEILVHPIFRAHHSETEMLRYIHKLAGRDLSLTTSMISLGSCTMKLNGTSEMIPVTWPELGRIHPYAPASQTAGYASLFGDLERWLAEITGFEATSLQPNAGAQGEYAGLLVIRAFHKRRGESHRDVCLIPTSAHGTNPASAALAGMKVVAVACDERGNVELADLREKAKAHAKSLAALMITYPSTHGVFEEGIREICTIVHEHGGQVYMDGANMNAQVGLSRPGDFGADVCHLNLHKTFCIPHGGGGPGMRPICDAKHHAPFLPRNPLDASDASSAIGPVNAASHGSASILPIPWVYIALMGAEGPEARDRDRDPQRHLHGEAPRRSLRRPLPRQERARRARVHRRLPCLQEEREHRGGRHRKTPHRLRLPRADDVVPVPGTLMIEPTESESKAELDRFCDALISIRAEIRAIEDGTSDKTDNPLKHAPHTAEAVTADEWSHRYSRTVAAYPAPWLKEHKFWPYVARVDNAYGDRNLICSCPSVEELASG